MRYRLDPLSPNGISLDVPSPVVKQGNGYVAKVQYLNELTDVTITGTPSDNQALAYDTASGKWIPQTISGGGGASQLSDLSDVNTSTPTNRNVLVADGVDFESRALVEADISDLGTYQTVLAEGAFADGDKTKLDGIEALADVTDTTNVTSAGALMDSELTSIASVKALNQGVATTDSPTFAGATLTGAAPALYLTESDQVSPAGTYRIDSSGDELRFIRSSTVLGKFNSTQFDLSNVALLLDASSNSEGLIAKSGATHIFSLYRQATPSNASAVLSAYGGIGFATGATGGAATSGFAMTIDNTGNTTLTGTLAGRDQTLTVANTDNKVGLTVTQNDTTNNPNGVTVTNAGTGDTLFIDHNNSGKAVNIDMDANSASSATGLHINVANAGAGGAYAAVFEAGSVGIGTTAPVTPLEVAATASGAETFALQLRNNATANNTAATLRFKSSTSATTADDSGASQISSIRTNSPLAGDVEMAFEVKGLEVMRMTKAGLGIGTTAPDNNLHIRSGSTTTLKIENTTNGEAQLNMHSSTSYTRLFYRHSAGDFGIYHKLATRFRITTSGDIGLCETSGSVGIGTTAPSEKLAVAGNVTSTTDSTYTLGTSSLYWSNTYTDRLYLNSTAYLDGGTAGLVAVSGDLSVSGYMPDVGRSYMRSNKLGMPINLDSGFTDTTTGSGTQYAGKLNYNILTGSTSGSTSGVVSWWNTYHQANDQSSRWQWGCRCNVIEPSDQMEYWVGYFSDTTTFPTATSNHYGFKLVSTSNGVNADLYATNGNGSAETSTLVASGLAQYTKFYVHVIYGSADIKYYYSTDNANWNLVATHTTNRPDGVSMCIGQWVKNTEAAEKRVEIMGIRLFEQ